MKTVIKSLFHAEQSEASMDTDASMASCSYTWILRSAQYDSSGEDVA